MNLILSSSNLYWRLFVLCGVLSYGVAAPAQNVSSYDKQRGQMMLDQVKNDIESHYYDPKFHGIDLDATFKAASEKIKNAQSNGQIMGIIAQAALDLEDSHTAILPPGRQAITDYGWEMKVIGDDVYVSRVKDKSDAKAKGLKVGDLVHQIGNYQPVRANLWKLVYLYYALRPQPGMQMLVSSPGGEQREVDVIAKVTTRPPIDLSNEADVLRLVLQDEVEDRERRKSHRTQELGDLLIWKMPGFNLSPDEVDAMMDKVRTHKALILDLRDNPGGDEETLLRLIGDLFDKDVKVGVIQRRKETKPLIARSRGDKAFKGQLIVLVDAASGSSAEVLARVVQLEKRGVVIGDRTEGAVMRARVYQHEVGVTRAAFFAVSVTDANLLMGDGKSLENVGVTPDEIKLPTGADLASMRDPVLAYAAKAAGVTIDPDKAGALFPKLKEKQ